MSVLSISGATFDPVLEILPLEFINVTPEGNVSVMAGDWLSSETDDVTLLNNGSIFADGTVAELEGVGASIFNNGSMSAFEEVLFLGIDSAVTNMGNITALGDATSAVLMDTGAQMNNIGSIVTQDLTAIRFVSSEVSEEANTIINSGLISTLADLAIQTADNIDHVTNSGDIFGGLSLGGADDIVTNTGAIYGDILMGDGDDTFANLGGTVTGLVAGGIGNDRYEVDTSGIVISEGVDEGTDQVDSSVNFKLGDNTENLTLTGADDLKGVGNDLDNFITGNGGDNILRGGEGDDTLWGEAGDDLMIGDQGQDILIGGLGGDTMRGGDDDDLMIGGIGNDDIRGGAGEDVLMGNGGDDLIVGREGDDQIDGGIGADFLRGDQGSDSISGGIGDDVIDGGRDQDILTGGLGADVFVFDSFADSRTSSADQITDFEVGIDLIQLCDIRSKGDFNFTGLDRVSADGNAEVILRSMNGGEDTALFADVNGDGKMDLRVNLMGVEANSLTIDDFVL